ncbi:phage repressor protein/antirepressor Ant [Escherichia coli]|uniref:BRO-N domain-containing protein n=1 Tax=Escherichia coli TaxID=562 RepID=UPI000BDECED2|nr:Bro-N domain-containing protein [Escherichia coli]EEQ9413062.1 phage repressor protein/antirepressor Ant [Escherichia coli]CAD5569045.1 antirepressor protein encoded by prophage CP-933N [Escherichia coli]CAD5570219.1 antirepressor protein encoded by prophage CP-933N [Escherichia coli]CAD5876962.1 antirepressor protein encoded by prophage CP-933N [Escherichia coli]
MKSIAKAQNDFTIFKFGDSEIRVINKCGEPWFVAKDVCDALALTNSRKALTALDDDEKGVTLSYTLGGEQNLSIVSESGMYTLVLRCRDAVNKGSVPHKFRKWVTAEVLPSIRKHGEYVKGKKTTVEERTPLRDAVNMLVGKKGLRYDDAYNMVHQRFGIDSIDELSIEQIPLAVEYIHRVVLEGEFIGKQEELPAQKLDINFPISWFAENAPYAIIRQQCGDTVALDRSALVECSPAYKLINILTKAGYDVSAVRAELKALRHLMAEQSWALKEIASFAAIRDRACHSIKL